MTSGMNFSELLISSLISKCSNYLLLIWFSQVRVEAQWHRQSRTASPSRKSTRCFSPGRNRIQTKPIFCNSKIKNRFNESFIFTNLKTDSINLIFFTILKTSKNFGVTFKSTVFNNKYHSRL